MSRTQANFILLFAAVIWGTTFVVQQVATGNLGAIMFTSSRFFMGGLFILPIAYIEYKRKQRSPNRMLPKDWLGMVVTGLVLFCGAALQQVGIQHTTIANAGFLTALYVPIVPFFAFSVLRAKVHWSVWPASLICLVGTYIMSGARSFNIGYGDLWVISSAFFWAAHVLLVGKMATKTQAPLVVAFVQFITCSCVGFIIGLIAESPSFADFDGAYLGIFYTGIFSVGTAFTLQVIAQRFSPAADTAVILSSETVFAALAGYIFLGEGLSVAQLFGTTSILTGILMVQLMPLCSENKSKKKV